MRPTSDKWRLFSQTTSAELAGSIVWQGFPRYALWLVTVQPGSASSRPDLLASALSNRGAVVKVVRLPDGPNGEKVGLDDYLVAHGKGALRKLLDAAEDPAPPAPDTMKSEASDIDPADEATVLLVSLEKDKLCRLRFWQLPL